MFDILYADPPWDYKGQKQHAGPGSAPTGGASTHYQTMSLEELVRINIQSVLSENALLFLWSTSPHLDQAITLLKLWGFDYATIGFVWNKGRLNPGFYTLSQCEICLIGKRGVIPRPRGSRKERQYLEEMRSAHSTKPDEVRSRIDRMFPTQRKLEIFARKQVEGWTCWGDELDSPVDLRSL